MGTGGKKRPFFSRRIPFVFYRLYRSLLSFFNMSYKDYSHHKGAVKELYEKAKEVKLKLRVFRAKVQTEMKEEVFISVAAIIDPMLKDVRRICYMLEQYGKNQLGEETLLKYKGRLEEAELWVNLYSSSDSKQDLLQAISTHVVQRAHAQIDRDCLLIEDYKTHRVSLLPFVEELKTTILCQVSEEINPELMKLKALKVDEGDIEIADLGKWRDALDEKRGDIVNIIFHKVDDTLEMYSPVDYVERESEKFYLDALNKVIILEKEVPELLEKSRDAELDDLSQRYEVAEPLQLFEEIVSELQADLRIPPDLVDRLDKVTVSIRSIRAKLDS